MKNILEAWDNFYGGKTKEFRPRALDGDYEAITDRVKYTRSRKKLVYTQSD
jgi:hypothetical protein